MSPLARTCADCSALVGEPCLADASRVGPFCLSRLVERTCSANVERGVVYVYERNRPAKHVVARVRTPARCSRCGRNGHNARNPSCPGRTP